MKGADLVILCTPVGAYEAVTKSIAAIADAGRDRVRCRLGQAVRGDQRWRRCCRRACISFPAHPIAGTEHSGPAAGFPELFANRWCILTPEARCRSGGGRAAAQLLALARLQCRGDGCEAPRHGARDHQPCAASRRLQHRRHGRRSRGAHAVRSDQVLGLGLPRFHAHCRERSGDVARRVPHQPRGGARNARALPRGPEPAAARGARRRRAGARGLVHPHPRHPPLDHRCRAGHRGRRTSAARIRRPTRPLRRSKRCSSASMAAATTPRTTARSRRLGAFRGRGRRWRS